jgi:hypothetical protein
MRLPSLPARIATATLVLFASTAHAQSADGHSAAVALFQQGTKLVQQGDCPHAIPVFVESLKQEEGVGAHLNLADCYDRTGAPARAWTEFKAAERFATLKRNDERREVAHNGAYALERKLLRLTLTVPYAEDLEVRINGTVVDADLVATRQVAIAPGSYTLEARAKHKKPVKRDGAGAAGEVQTVSIAFEDDPSEVAPQRSAPAQDVTPPPSSSQKTTGIIVGIAGIAAIAAGSIFGVVALDDKNKLKRAFDSTPGCSGGYPGGSCTGTSRPDLDSRESSASQAATLSTVFFIVGGAALAVGATIFFTAPKERPTAKKPASQLNATARALLLGASW